MDHITHTDHVEVAIANGVAAQIPILIGTNGDEAASLYAGVGKATGELLWAPAVGSTTPSFDELCNATVDEWGDHTTLHILNLVSLAEHRYCRQELRRRDIPLGGTLSALASGIYLPPAIFASSIY